MRGYLTYFVAILIIILGVYQFFQEGCESGLKTILLGAGFIGVRRAIGNRDDDYCRPEPEDWVKR